MEMDNVSVLWEYILTALRVPDANEYIERNGAFYRLHFILTAFLSRHLRLCSCQDVKDAGMLYRGQLGS